MGTQGSKSGRLQARQAPYFLNYFSGLVGHFNKRPSGGPNLDHVDFYPFSVIA